MHIGHELFTIQAGMTGFEARVVSGARGNSVVAFYHVKQRQLSP